jgi:hypothetical protein
MMRRDYFIMHYPKDNERAIMRTNEDDAQYLSSNNEWTREKKRAKRFYHRDSAEWALVLCKIKWLKEEELQRPEVEKQSWDEL